MSDDAIYQIIKKLKENIFTDGDVFLDVFPVIEEDKEILDEEYITPIKDNKPNPIKLVKVCPGTVFEFCFLLREFSTEVKDNEYPVRVSEEEKIKLFRAIVMDMGIGARTNVGFGKMTEVNIGRCKVCGNETKINSRTGQPYEYCHVCGGKKSVIPKKDRNDWRRF